MKNTLKHQKMFLFTAIAVLLFLFIFGINTIPVHAERNDMNYIYYENNLPGIIDNSGTILSVIIPDTGDNAQLQKYLYIICIAGMCLIVLLVFNLIYGMIKRKKDKKKKQKKNKKAKNKDRRSDKNETKIIELDVENTEKPEDINTQEEIETLINEIESKKDPKESKEVNELIFKELKKESNERYELSEEDEPTESLTDEEIKNIYEQIKNSIVHGI